MTRRKAPSNLVATIARFWSRVEKSDGCWLWTGELNGTGYGRFRYVDDATEGRYTRVLAHRLSVQLSGRPIPPGLVIMHTCDTRRCVRPDHLMVGTHKDNVQDAKRKGRMNTSGFNQLRDRTCPDCGVVFQGVPRKLRCDDCKLTKTEEWRRWRDYRIALSDWAANQGIPVSRTGTISPALREAYERATA